MNCPTCALPVDEHTEEMAANCAVFDISAAAVPRTSEAETAPGVGEGSPPPAAPGASSPVILDRNDPSFYEFKPLLRSNVSVASVLLGWCNDIKRELEEFANDGPVGPMVPYHAEPNARPEDVLRLRESLGDLIKTLYDLREDARGALTRGFSA